MNDYITKPLDKNDLENILVKWLKSTIDEEDLSLPKDTQEPKKINLSNLIDMEAFISSKEMMADKFGMILQCYIEEGENYIETLKADYKLQNYEDYKRAAHSLKSSSKQFGFNITANYANEIEGLINEDYQGLNESELLEKILFR